MVRLGEVFRDLLFSIFLFIQGRTYERNKQNKKDLKDAERGSKRRNNVKNIDDNTLRSGLRYTSPKRKSEEL